MNVNIRVAVGFGDFIVIKFGEPVVGGDSTGIVEDKTAHGISHC